MFFHYLIIWISNAGELYYDMSIIGRLAQLECMSTSTGDIPVSANRIKDTILHMWLIMYLTVMIAHTLFLTTVIAEMLIYDMWLIIILLTIDAQHLARQRYFSTCAAQLWYYSVLLVRKYHSNISGMINVFRSIAHYPVYCI